MMELWGEAVRAIEAMVKPAHRDQWLRPIECVGIANGRIRLRAPNRYHQEWFRDHYLPSILQDLEARPHTVFVVEFEEVDDTPAPRLAGALAPAVEVGPAPAAAAPPRGLEPRYTFDKFVVGPTNQFAHAAAR